MPIEPLAPALAGARTRRRRALTAASSVFQDRFARKNEALFVGRPVSINLKEFVSA